jgi:hypothetical protein
MGPGILNASKALGELGSVLDGLELRLRVGGVIGDTRSAVALGYIQIDQQVMQELMFKAARMVHRARQWVLGLGANDRAFAVFERHGCQLDTT